MIIEEILSPYKLMLLKDKYDSEYINSIDESNLIKIYNLFKKYGFYYVDDILVNYLELFNYDSNYIEECIINFNKLLGNDYINIIGNNMRYFERIIIN